MKILLFLLILFNSNFAFADDIPKFAYLNVSFARDIDRSVNMYKFFEKHNKDSDPNLYIAVPEKDLKLFNDKFNEAKIKNEIKKMPIIISKDFVLKKCSIYDDVKKLFPNNGWKRQQVVKLCFYKTGFADEYVTLDSDISFIKDFDKSLFYDKETGLLKAIMNKHIADGNLAEKDIIKIKSFFNINDNKPLYYFVEQIGLVSKANLENLLKKIQENGLQNFAEMINYAPWEYQWYGQYVYSFSSNIVAMPNIVVTLETNLKKKGKIGLCHIIARDMIFKQNKYIVSLGETQGLDELTLDEFIANNCEGKWRYKFWLLKYRILNFVF